MERFTTHLQLMTSESYRADLEAGELVDQTEEKPFELNGNIMALIAFILNAINPLLWPALEAAIEPIAAQMIQYIPFLNKA